MFDLEKQFVFYGSYHNNPVNVLIHIVFVWVILGSAIAMLQLTPAFGSMPEFVTKAFGSELKVNAALGVCLFLSTVYIVMDPFVGLIGKFWLQS